MNQIVSSKQTHLYKGRKSFRSDGETKRLMILEATLDIIAEEGIRGVRHRAVATRANISLASTTYYFKEIGDLISDSLIYFAEKLHDQTILVEQTASVYLGDLNSKGLNESDKKKYLCNELIKILSEHSQNQIRDKKSRILEQAFADEALRNTTIAKALKYTDERMLKVISLFFEHVGIDNVKQSAFCLFSTLRMVELQALVGNDQTSNEQDITNLITYLIERIIVN